MKKLSFLLIVLTLSFSAYGQNLVYSISINASGMENYRGIAFAMERELYHGYVVVDSNLVGEMDMIVYGRDVFNNRVYQFITVSTVNFLLTNDGRDCVFHFIFDIGGEEVSGDAVLSGAPRWWNIGGGTMAYIPGSMRGNILLYQQVVPFVSTTTIYGYGTVSARLNIGMTRIYNNAGLDFGEAVDALESYVQSRGYVPY